MYGDASLLCRAKFLNTDLFKARYGKGYVSYIEPVKPHRRIRHSSDSPVSVLENVLAADVAETHLSKCISETLGPLTTVSNKGHLYRDVWGDGQAVVMEIEAARDPLDRAIVSLSIKGSRRGLSEIEAAVSDDRNTMH